MIFAGIDPGREGAIAWMSGTRDVIEVHDTPLSAAHPSGYDVAGMAALVRRMISAVETASPCGLCPGPVKLTIEKVHALPHDGRSSAFTFGVGLGLWYGILDTLGVSYQAVDPQRWKRTMIAGIANDGAAEALALERRFAGRPLELRGPRGGLRTGRVDALFLAEYARVTARLGG